MTLLSTSLFTAANAYAQNSQSSTTDVEQFIWESAQQFVDAFNKGDASAIAALWTKDGELVDETGKRTTGRAAIEQEYADFFQNHSGAKIEIAIDSIQQLTPETVIEDGHSLVTLASPSGATSTGNYLAIHTKQDGKWLIASVREFTASPSTADVNLQDLAWLVGTWTGAGDDAQLEVTFDWTRDGNFIRGETTINSDENTVPGGMQIIGKDPLTGRLLSWSFNADGGHGIGEWAKSGSHWVISNLGITADGTPTSAANILYDAGDDVLSWQSANRFLGDQPLPRTKEIVLERKSDSKPQKETTP